VTGGPRLELEVERVVAGGRMIARHEGRVVLVAGAIAGERVLAEVERVQKGVAFARVVEVLRADAGRRDPGADPACGGLTFAHVRPDRQRELKAGIVADAFSRIARLPVGAALAVHASPEHAYRMRVRVHLRDGRLGSFREGTHEICPLALTRQASLACVEAVGQVERCLRLRGLSRIEAIDIAENLDGSERVLHLDCAQGESVDAHAAADLAAIPSVTGVSTARAWSPRILTLAGVPWVSDPVIAYSPSAPAAAYGTARLRRRARAFFQANRFLAPALVAAVLARLPDAPVVDLYAGVGLFAVSAAAAGWPAVTAVEGDPISAADLAANASAVAGRLHVSHAAVEETLAGGHRWSDATVIVDPPRTGMSRAAVGGLVAARPRRIVYVSCDVATLARDARRLVEAGYEMGEVEAFDLFPNTAHVEALTDFTRARP
jgi:23S rRNA (uracil1939-C5)-methyltransferase